MPRISELDPLPWQSEFLRAGLSGPILHHPAVHAALRARTPFQLHPVEGSPIEGVRRLLLRAA